MFQITKEYIQETCAGSSYASFRLNHDSRNRANLYKIQSYQQLKISESESRDQTNKLGEIDRSEKYTETTTIRLNQSMITSYVKPRNPNNHEIITLKGKKLG